MQHLQLVNQIVRFTPESLGYLNLLLLSLGRFRELLGYLLLAEGIILKLLSRLLAVYHRSEDVVQTELSREDVHHHMNCALIRFTPFFSLSRRFVRKAV